MDNLEEILQLLKDGSWVESPKQDSPYLLEYAFGSSFKAARYLQRFGSPGHYTYVYSPEFMRRYGRKASFFFARFLKKSGRFINKIKVRYDAMKINVKPQSLTTAILHIQKGDGGILDLGVNLQKHQIYSYRSRRGISGASTKLSKAKRQGVLRYR